MSATNDWQFAVEEYPPHWHFPAGSSWIAGWIYAGENRYITDLRAWVDGRVFLGLPGLPKPGLDEKLLGRAGPPYSGFVLQVKPHCGAKMIRLEARSPDGIWTEFFRTDIRVEESADPYPGPKLLSALLPAILPAFLRLHAQRHEASLAMVANEVISGSLAEPLNSLPVPPFHGALEEPREFGWLRYGRLSVTGWLAHRTVKIVQVTALVDAVQESILLYGLPRDDIGGVFADLPDQARSQFVGHVDLPANQSEPPLLKVFAELSNGEKHLVFAQRFTPRVIAGADVSLPPLSRLTFFRALWHLRSAAKRYRIPLGPWAGTIKGAKIAWAHYRAEAPPAIGHRPVLTAPTSAPHSKKPLSILVATHNLNFEGAPCFIFEYARHMQAQRNVSVSVISSQEGPMRRVFNDAGITVEVINLTSALEAGTMEDFSMALKSATNHLDWGRIDLLVANTMVSFWAIHIADWAGKPSLLYVHESSPIRRFFAPVLAAPIHPMVEDAFRLAHRVVFTADSSRKVYDYLNGKGNFTLLPSWVDIRRIDDFVATNNKSTLRQKHGLDPDAVILVNIGSVCERKGQHIFIRAIELLKEELRHTYPDRKIQFLMVGARPGVYLESLKQELQLHGLEQAKFIPETGEIFDYYRMADIFVCTSFEESFPRVLLESAAFRLPIISTNVNGITEMLAKDEAWIIPPGDRYQLGDAIKQALAAHFAKDTSKAGRARASVERRYHEDSSLPLHYALTLGTLAEKSKH
jgi:glycosyltransferase involved in cell wall biosynthesis